MCYFANIGPVGGPLKERDAPPVIGLLESPAGHAYIGHADCIGRDADGNALFLLDFRGARPECVWLLVDREFRPAHQDGR